MNQKKQYVFGLHSVAALIKTSAERVFQLAVQKGRQDEKLEAIVQAAKEQGIAVEVQSKQVIDKMTDNANHQGIVAFCRPAKALGESDLKLMLEKLDEAPFLLVLDGVQDPHNLGACFRSADAAGVHAIIAPKDNSVGITPVVRKVASGAAEVLPFFQVTNLARTLKMIKDQGIWIYGAAGEGSKICYRADLTGPTAIVMGAEGKGLRRLTREHCDVLLRIPMTGTVESLNVSVATGVLLFEAVRQRGLYAR